MRTAAAQFDDIPGQLPESKVPDEVDNASIGRATIEKLNDLKKHDLAPFVIWRELLLLTDTFRTFQSAETVLEHFTKLRIEKNCSEFRLSEENSPRRIDIPNPPTSWLDFDVAFTVKDDELVGNGAGVVSVMRTASGDWKIWMLRTWLENYESHGHPDETDAPSGTDLPSSDDGQVYEAAIVGGGQRGLGVAGRLQALGIRNILFDERPLIGDSWGHRYDSLKWHTLKEYGNLPLGRTFHEEDPDLLPKQRIASGYKEWSLKHNLNVRENTRVVNAVWDGSSRTWSIEGKTASGTRIWKAKNLVLTIGPGHKTPVSPEWATPEKIKGSGYTGTIMHSTSYHNPDGFANKRGIVIGTANTAHDVAEDMANLNMHVTMVQRPPTFIFPGEWLVKSEAAAYHRDKPTELSDRQDITRPSKILREIANRNVHNLIKQHPELFDRLESVGFKVDRYGDLFTHLYIRFGGHYVNIGASERIVAGEIKVKTSAVKGLNAEGLQFEDGTEIPADLIVLATGFNHDFREDAAQILGRDVADTMDDYWSSDVEGELRGYARFAGHPSLYYGGGECRYSRFFSRFIALQIQKEILGYPLKPYLEGRK